MIATYFSVFKIAFKYILARSVSITFTTYVKIILSNSKDVYSRGNHLEMKFLVKSCKKHLVKIGTIRGSVNPQVPPLLPTQPAQFTGMGYVGRSGGTWGCVGPKIGFWGFNVPLSTKPSSIL